jgi:hypothetical protein
MTIAVDEAAKIERIRRAFAEDIEERPLARSLSDIPAFYECLTPEWLTAVVRRKHPGATVTGFTLDAPDSGTTNRRRIFLKYASQEEAGRYPRSLFCKAAQDLANRITMSSGSAMGEVRFYNQVRPKIEFDAPEAYFASVDPDSFRAIIVLDDMADEVEFCNYQTPMSLARAQSQLDVLARMHSRFYENRDLDELRPAFDTWRARFDRISNYHGLAEACYNGLLVAEPVVPKSLVDRIDEVWPLTLQSVARVANLPQTITHGDDHLGNWYIRPDDALGLTDFQNITIGHWSRDVAYAITTALTVENRRAWEKDLLKYYLDRLKTYSPSVQESFDESWLNYRQQMISVLTWWTVTLTPSPTMAQEMQTKETTLCFLERIGHAMHDLETLDAF